MKDNIATAGNILNGEALSGINTLQSLTPSELFWYQRLVALQPLQLPFDISHKIAEPRWAISRWQSPLPQNGQEEPWRILLQAFVIYLARLTQQSAFQIGWCVALNDNRTNLASVVPMDIEVALDEPWHGVAGAVDDELVRLAQHQTFSYDLLSHSLSLHAIPELSTRHPWPVAVSVIQDGRQCDQKASGELLTLQINEQGGFRWIYDENRLSAEVIARMDEHLQVLLLSKERGDGIPIGQLNLLPEAERVLLLETWNPAETLYPEALCIHQLFEQQVQKTPQATALEYQGQTLSYTELNARANRLAHQLIEQGLEPEQRVAICVARSPAMVVSLLAVLKAGGAYVPLDITYPAERLTYILNDSAPSVILADNTGQSILGNEVLSELTVLDPTIQPDQPGSNPQVSTLTPQHLSYVIYTSGSTGQPKGVMVEHQAIYQRTLGVNELYGVTAQDRVLQFAAFAFDVSVEECFSSLCHGATLVIRDDSWLESMTEFIALARENRITVMFLPTLFWSELAGRDPGLSLPDALRLIIIGSEAVQKKALQDWFAQESHRPRLLNAYGPTENTVTATCQEVFSSDYDRSIGRPLRNTRIYLLDRNGQPVPLGCAGEIYIGGVGVARGYLNQLILSEERFIPDPFSPLSDARMYRTGDVARYLPDGNLEFLGRNDQQVKIRGFRVELGEIETRLLEHPAVNQAAVLALDNGQSKRLVAYIVAETVVAEENQEWVNSLRTHLSALLPDYMMPAAFVRLDSFPQTPNGKLDRRALPAPNEEAFVRRTYEAPQGREETILAVVWGELLGIKQISRHDSFFALGGHSLLAMRMIERLRHQGLMLAASDLFRSPVLSDLVKTLGQHRAIEVPPNVITPAIQQLTPAMLPLADLTQADIDHIVEQVSGGVVNIQDIYALSPLQDGILFHHLLAREGDPYLLTSQMAFADRSILDRYLAAMQRIVERHDILRTAFIWQGVSVPVQVVCRQAPLSVTELALNPADGPVIDQLSQRFDPRHYRLDLSQPPLLHFVIAQETDGRWHLLQLLHHLIGDHTTLDVMHREVQSYLAGQEEHLPVPVPFRNLVAQARLGVSQESHTRFFTEMLAEVEEPTLPFGLTEVHHDGSQVTEFHQMLAPELNGRLRSQARRFGVSLAALCHLAWAQVLSRTSGQEKVVFGTVLFGRMAAGEGADSGVGLFINTLPLRLDMDDTPVQDSVQATHRRLAGLLAHEHASLALAQQCSGIDRGTPLFSALLNYRHNAVSAMSEERINGIEFVSEQERTNYPFVLSVDDFGEVLGLTVQVAQPVEPERVYGYMQQALESLADALEHTPDMPVRALDILPEAERTLLLTTWNTTETPYPESLCIHQLFEQQVEKTPQATALIAGDKTLSYRELNTRANQLARQLIGQGVCPGDHIVLLFERSMVLVVAQLAVLKAGAVYVPLDPGVPDERKNWLVNDCSAKLLLTDTQTDIPADLVVPLLRLSDENKTTGEQASEQNNAQNNTQNNTQNSINLDLPRAGTELAYIMYTSGSTGTPKGVLVPHRAVVRLVINNGYAAIEPDDRVAFTANPAFDASTFEVWAPLLNGGALVVIEHAMLLTPVELVRALQTHRITVLWLTIGLFNRLAVELSPALRQIKTLIFGGDIPDLSVIAQVLKHRPPQQLLQAYGPTEGTTFTTIYPIEALAQGMIRLPIGRPIANTRVYLLDSHGQPVPLGATGEIYVGGDGVACGYLNRPELTAERFLIDPFSDTPDARLYRTGDLARYRPDGNLEFLGRNDQQVKIRGFRIEPGEIEIRLAEHPAVREATVLVLGDGGDKRLVAYVVADIDEELVNRLRTHLSAVLPDYMVPVAFVRLDEFPLTPNGKLDRRALPAPDSEAFARQIYAAPQGETEMALAAIWSELLGIEQVSRHDSFFALGGHSLLAVRMIERLRQQGLALTARDLFRSPVLSDLAQTLGRHQAIEVPPNVITPETQHLTPEMLPLVDLTQADIDHIVKQVPGGVANIQDIYALSPLQDGILFHHLLAHEGDPYLLTEQMAFADRSLLDRYLAAMQRIVERHDILRTAFIWQGVSVPVQVVGRQASLSVTELTLDPADGPVSSQLAERFNVSHYRLDLSDAPLLRFVVAQEADGRWIVLQLLHHLIGDHETVEVMHREVQACLTGQEENLAVPVPYRNLVAQARLGVSQEAHTRFFTEMLAEVEEPTLPFGLTEVHRDGSQMTESHQMLAPELNDRLRSQARRFGVSLAALCHLAWAQVLSRTSGQEKVVFGTVLFGRMAAGGGADSGMGLFINTLPLRLDMDDTPVQDSVQAAHRRLAGLLTHEHASLALAQQCSGVERGTPLFSALLNYRHNDQLNQLDKTLEGIELLDGQERTNYPFVLSVEDFGEALGLTAQVVQPFEPARVCGYMQQALESLADALEQAPETPVRQLVILPEAECTLLLKTWNATEAAYPEALCIHQLFEQQVEKTPQATALVYEKQTLSYAELNARANRLAHQLIALGIEPEQRVAICVSRSPAMVIGLLAVLKTGGAYVPLDPAYPGERLAYNLRDAAPAIVLADNIGRTALGEQALAERKVLDPNTRFDRPDNNPQIPVLTSRHLACVIYTSGSTGTPKGVMVEHRGLVNLIQEKITQFAICADSRVLQFASLGFDASVWEIMMSLCSGATLDIPADSVRQNPIYLWHYLEAQAITHACLTPALLHDGADIPALTVKPTLILGGEALNTALLRALCGRVTLFNAYGPTEITVCATTWYCPSDYTDTAVPIGRPTANTQVYLLDAHCQPVPLGAVGELYIGGVGVTRGYLNRPELTAERFLIDPFSDTPDARLYRTGDLARYRPDGNLEFLGRNDQQVKIRGFRIEPGEIEARLAEHPVVRESVVLAQGEGQDKRLVAYLVTETKVTETKAADTDEGLANSLRAHLSVLLPDYMVPAAFVRLDAFPLTPNGKLDRRALPSPDSKAFARQTYAAPQGETEMALAAIWSELLGIEQISRHDSFFALGGHSLLAVRMIERLRQQGVALTARDLFRSPVLSDLAQTLGRHQAVEVPPNAITPETQHLTPEMLPLVDLTQADIDLIVRQVPGGVANIQDIYALSPLQDGILFHHLLAREGDPYLLADQMAFADRSLLDRYLVAIQRVVDRHDILRTAFIWQGVSVPVQVVWRHAPLSVTELTLDPADGPVSRQLDERFNINQYRLDLSDAPLLRFVVAQEADGRWIVLQLQHHLIGDHETLEVMHREVLACLTGQEESLPVPVPFRNLVAQVRLGVSQEAYTRFFTEMLAEVEEPTLPFGLAEVYHDGAQETESYRLLPPELNDRLRNQARQQGVSLAALCHLAWAQVLSRTSGQEKVVFGTVLFGRMTGGEGTEGGMGLFINTLPLRLDMDDTPVRDSVQAAHRRLAGLLAHEHASLALAQQCSGVERGTPLFSALLNYRHNSPSDPLDNTLDGFEFLEVQERTNYPFGLSVEDGGETLGLTANVVQPFDPERICGYMQQALESLADALEHTPEMPVRALEILPEAERTLLLNIWNGTKTAYPESLCIHQLFEQQAQKTPETTALEYQGQRLSYAELNTRANRLAHQLIESGVEPEQRVAICVTRSPAMVVSLLAVLKAGGAYVPLDITYPTERLAYILSDSAPSVILADGTGQSILGDEVLAELTVLDPTIQPDQPDSNPQVSALTPQHLAYVIYTSGSTGQPKGVMVEHQAIYQRTLGVN
ncbi:non-ribosomal peptide synthetase, partial [Xenorhabdus miraniensis]|uniref:non-ribosomal peptide synthetase n=1 Tax=Xenorhabdus miraniensis TaxID=351674 RepID=UPI000C048D21